MSRFKFHRPSPALAVSLVALFVALGGSAVAATTLLIHTKNIANGAVTNHKLANGAVGLAKLNTQVRSALTSAGTGRGIVGSTGGNGAAGSNGSKGSNGSNGRDGRDGANPATPVIDVPAISSASGNPNPDSGAAGDGGWYFSGNGSSGSAQITNGELDLTGNGVDANTEQGGIGIAKAFDNVPLGNLDALTYQWHVNLSNAKQAPSIHITVTGLTANSHFASGFANLDYNPGINGITPSESVLYQSDGFAPNANWFSTTEGPVGGSSDPNLPGGQNNPETLATFVSNNPNAVITQISLDNGGTSGGTGTFDAGADNLLLGFNGTNTRYDFGG